MALVKLDLPTFGLPIKVNVTFPSISEISLPFGNSSTIRSSKSPIPIPCAPETITGSPKPKE